MATTFGMLTKPVSYGARQTLNLARTALRTGASVVGAIVGSGGSEQSAEAPSEAQPRGARPQRSRRPKPLDDVSITRKVETQLFRDSTVPKGKIDVNTADGVVWLRGEAKNPEMIKRLEREAREIPEVQRVENLLHLPKTPAPSRTDTPPTQRKTRRSRSTPTPSAAKRRVSEERKPKTPSAEPSPSEHAAERRGRTPAPLGTAAADGGGADQATETSGDERTG
jgi:BON domain